ncbi:hypothetical protein [Mycolicibacterium sp. NCC-Tsukiji]|uniref:hypothetical protein n=1 Tax=Mycolicibacterium sp. NCC-Tsukiji TaxID=2185272 RepID=UPI001FCE8E48|nr:hypothetical protein [Mycolicibacterium sp. NCC-Tsukiji]
MSSGTVPSFLASAAPSRHRLAAVGGRHGFGEQHVQPAVRHPQPVEGVVRLGPYGLERDQRDPGFVQELCGAVPGVG